MAHQKEALTASLRALETLDGGTVELEDLAAAQASHVVVMALAGAFEAAVRCFKKRPVGQPDARENLERPEYGRPPYAWELPAQVPIDGLRGPVDMRGGEG
ncbi:MAG: hypothetical protein PHU21_11310, partial [Elusimicrobia bacterium]|nr:hypothetical protein [Elusimicrobiota bacterium]